MCGHICVCVSCSLDKYLVVSLFCTLHQHEGLTFFSLFLSNAGPKGASGRVQEAQVEACRGSICSHADWGRREWSRFTSRRSTGWGAPGRGTGPPAAQDAPGDSYADPGGPQQTAGVPAAQAQGATATGTVQCTCYSPTETLEIRPFLSFADLEVIEGLQLIVKALTRILREEEILRETSHQSCGHSLVIFDFLLAVPKPRLVIEGDRSV